MVCYMVGVYPFINNKLCQFILKMAWAVILFGHFYRLMWESFPILKWLFFPNFMYFSTYFPNFYDVRERVASQYPKFYTKKGPEISLIKWQSSVYIIVPMSMLI